MSKTELAFVRLGSQVEHIFDDLIPATLERLIDPDEAKKDAKTALSDIKDVLEAGPRLGSGLMDALIGVRSFEDAFAGLGDTSAKILKRKF